MISSCRSLLTSALLAAAVCVAAPTRAQAGPLLDWLFGRQPTYVAGYAPIAAASPGQAAGGAAANWQAGYAPAYQVDYLVPQTAATAPSYSAGYAPTAPGYSAGYAPSTASYAPATGGHAQPATSYSPGTAAACDPCTAGSAPSYSASAPATTSAAPAIPVQPVTSFYGTGNVYPTAPMAAAPNLSPTNYQTYRPATGGGLFSRLRGLFHHRTPTSYQTQYYRAAVTYYRPVVTAAPSTGGQTTALAPCTSYQLQPQRMPQTNPLAPTQPQSATPPPCPTDPCPEGTSGAPSTGYGTSPGATTPPGYGASPGDGTSGAQPAPPAAAPGSPSDATDLDRPRLQSQSNSTVVPGSGSSVSGYSNYSTDGASQRRRSGGATGPIREPSGGSSVRPIPAPAPAGRSPDAERHEPQRSVPEDRGVRTPLQANAPAEPAWGSKTIEWRKRESAAVRPASAERSAAARQTAPRQERSRARYDDGGWSAGPAR